jgi:hypothetical protein
VANNIVSILDFAYRIGFTSLYDWQCRILLRYEAGEPIAAALRKLHGQDERHFPDLRVVDVVPLSASAADVHERDLRSSREPVLCGVKAFCGPQVLRRLAMAGERGADDFGRFSIWTGERCERPC